MRRASGRARSRMAGSISASNNTASARWSAFTARSVSRSGLPGPAPTSVALPTASFRGHANIAQDLLKFRNTGTAVGAGPQQQADLLDGTRPMGGYGMADGITCDAEAGADFGSLGSRGIIHLAGQDVRPRGVRHRSTEHRDHGCLVR